MGHGCSQPSRIECHRRTSRTPGVVRKRYAAPTREGTRTIGLRAVSADSHGCPMLQAADSWSYRCKLVEGLGDQQNKWRLCEDGGKTRSAIGKSEQKGRPMVDRGGMTLCRKCASSRSHQQALLALMSSSTMSTCLRLTRLINSTFTGMFSAKPDT